MISLPPCERDLLHRQLGERNERILQLERQNAMQKALWESDACEWQRLQRHRRDLEEWLIDAATDERGRMLKSPIDAGLCGESFVPGTTTVTSNGKQYRLSIGSTLYDVEEI